MGVGSRIKHYRKAAGMTQAQLGKAVGIGESAVRNYEREIRTPKQETVDAMAEAMGIVPEALAETGLETGRGALEILFRIEDDLGLVPVETKDGMAIAIDSRAKGAQKASAALKAWKRMRDGVSSGKVSKDEYEYWKASFKG